MRTTRLFLSGLILSIVPGMVVLHAQSSGARIEGVVIDGATERPIPAVTIQIEGLKMSTDAEGHFGFDDVTPGPHTLLADKNGYLRATYEGRKTGSSGIMLNLASGQSMQSLTLRMFRGGSATGRIYGNDGSPLPGMAVIPYRAVYDDNGDMVLKRLPGANSPASPRESQWSSPVGQAPLVSGNPVAAGVTNNMGEYRVTNLEPGRYSFYVTPVFPMAAELPEYYPGTMSPADASIVEIESGKETPLRNMTMAVDTPANLRVQVIDQTGQAGTSAFVQVFRKGGADVLYQWPNLGRTSNASCERDQAACTDLGSFSVGAYEIEAVVYIRRNSFVASNRVPLQMTGKDVRLDLPVGAGTAISGDATRAPTLDTNAVHEPVNGLTLTLNSSTTIPNVAFPISSGEDGTFKIGSLPSGLFRVTGVSGVPAGFCLDELRQDDRNVLRDGLLVSGTNVSLRATLHESRSSIRGKVTDTSGKSVGGGIVVLMPDDRSRSELYSTAVTDQNGLFDMSCLQQGKYHLYSWVELDGAAYRNSEFMRKYDGQEQSVDVPAIGTLTVDARILH
jgi:hypothetical protein